MIHIAHIIGGVLVKELFCKIWGKIKEEFFTIPNMLSILRLLLIPVIVYLYCFKKDTTWTLILVIFSSLTDVVDGFIARRFNMITDFGKFIDPVADKATQLTVFFCLVTRYPLMLLPFIVLLVKELSSLALRLWVYKKTELVEGAHWHGKMSTTIVIVIIISHLIWPEMHPSISEFMIYFSTIFMVYSGILYALESFDMLKNGKK